MLIDQRGCQPSRAVLMFAEATPASIILIRDLVIMAVPSISEMLIWLQIIGRTVVPALEEAIIFSFTPLWACSLTTLLGEEFGLQWIKSGAMILISTIFCSRESKLRPSTVPCFFLNVIHHFRHTGSISDLHFCLQLNEQEKDQGLPFSLSSRCTYTKVKETVAI